MSSRVERNFQEYNKLKDTDDNIQELLPAKLQQFKDAFDEVADNKLPSYQPCDCEISLKPDSTLFYRPIYLLKEKESIALKEYINENLAKGFIRK